MKNNILKFAVSVAAVVAGLYAYAKIQETTAKNPQEKEFKQWQLVKF